MSKDTPKFIVPYDLSVIESPSGFYKTLLQLHDAQQKYCLPAIVKEYDATTGNVTVLPLAKLIQDTEDGELLVNRPEYTVPLHRISYGGVEISITPYIGDTGYLIAVDRDCGKAIEDNSERILEDQKVEEDKFGLNKGPQKPNTRALGSFTWGYFEPCYWGVPNQEHKNGITIAFTTPIGTQDTANGEISISTDGIKLYRKSTTAEDAITISDNGIKYTGKTDKTFDVIADLQYDTDKHQLQKRTITQGMRGDFIVAVSGLSDWTMIDGGQAEPVPVQE